MVTADTDMRVIMAVDLAGLVVDVAMKMLVPQEACDHKWLLISVLNLGKSLRFVCVRRSQTRSVT